jgi:hypothetical protein
VEPCCVFTTAGGQSCCVNPASATCLGEHVTLQDVHCTMRKLVTNSRSRHACPADKLSAVPRRRLEELATSVRQISSYVYDTIHDSLSAPRPVSNGSRALCIAHRLRKEARLLLCRRACSTAAHLCCHACFRVSRSPVNAEVGTLAMKALRAHGSTLPATLQVPYSARHRSPLADGVPCRRVAVTAFHRDNVKLARCQCEFLWHA